MLGWGALYEGKPAFGSWSNLEQCLHTNQGGLRSRSPHRLANRLVLWAQSKLLSLREVHVLDRLNQVADMLPGEWRLHP